MTSAIIQTGGKQYQVTPGQLVKIEKLNAAVGATVTFDRVLAVMTDGTTEMHPAASTVVTAEVVEQGKGQKIRVFTYKSKKRQRRTLGHRQLVTTVRIASVGTAKPAEASKKTPVAKVAPAKKAPVKKVAK